MTDTTKHLTNEEKYEILSRVGAISKALADLELVLDQGRKGEFKNHTSLVAADGGPDNMFFVLPDIMKDYEVLSGSTLPFLEFVGCFEAWTGRLALSINLNKPHLSNKAVMSHMEKLVDMCKIIEFATKAYFGGGTTAKE